MTGFTLNIHSPKREQQFTDSVSFTGLDASGRFTIYARHVHMVTDLSFGLHWFKTADGKRHYLAIPGGAMRFYDNELAIDTLHFVLSDSSEGIIEDMEAKSQQAQTRRQRFLFNIRRLERSFIKQLKKV